MKDKITGFHTYVSFSGFRVGPGYTGCIGQVFRLNAWDKLETIHIGLTNHTATQSKAPSKIVIAKFEDDKPGDPFYENIFNPSEIAIWPGATRYNIDIANDTNIFFKEDTDIFVGWHGNWPGGIAPYALVAYEEDIRYAPVVYTRLLESDKESSWYRLSIFWPKVTRIGMEISTKEMERTEITKTEPNNYETESVTKRIVKEEIQKMTDEILLTINTAETRLTSKLEILSKPLTNEVDNEAS